MGESWFLAAAAADRQTAALRARLVEVEQAPCRKCGYSGGCMESWEMADGTMVDCGTCPACRAVLGKGERTDG